MGGGGGGRKKKKKNSQGVNYDLWENEEKKRPKKSEKETNILYIFLNKNKLYGSGENYIKQHKYSTCD